jgi:hypothetical protein
VPVVQFKKQSLSTKEDLGLLEVELTRSGDLTYKSSVSCFTRQDTAKAGEDFTERTKTDSYLVTFNSGESSKSCEVIITNDLVYEGEERFRLVLEATSHNARIGNKNKTIITIDDPEDGELLNVLWFA